MTDLETGGVGEQQVGAGEQIGDEGEGEPITPETYLRDLTEDDVYSRLQQAGDFPTRLSAAESRMMGKLGPLTERLQGVESSLGTRQEIDVSGLKALDDYDPKLREVLEKILPGIFNSTPLDSAAIQPFLDPVREQMQEYVDRQIVTSAYSANRLAEIIPEVKDDVFVPQGQLQEDFVTWITQQDYPTQEALQTLGPNYVRALQKFEKWESEQQKERDTVAEGKASRLAGGGQPSARGRRAKIAGPQTQEEAFLAGFNDVIKQQ